MKIAEIRKQTATNLTKQATELRDEITELRRRIHVGETQNVRVLRGKRKDLARVLTVLGEQLSKETN